MRDTYRTYYHSDIGWLEVVSTEESILSVEFVEAPGSHEESAAEGAELPAVLRVCAQQLEEYFKGERRSFSLNLAPPGTLFQQEVWRALETIPYGETRSYAQMAQQIGRPKAYRAVGHANGQNKIAIILPCHRVVGRGGRLTGYGGGLWRKAWLLQHEQKG